MGTKGYFPALKSKEYSKLLVANLINRFGDAIDTLAFAWIVYEFTGEGMWAAIVFAVNKIPSFILMPFAGAYVEKKNKKRMLLISDFVRSILVLLLIGAIVTDNLSLVLLVIFSFLVSVAESFRIPAGNSFITFLLDKEVLDKGVTLNALASIIMEVLGTASGGLIIHQFGIQWAFIIDFITFVFSLSVIALIKFKEQVDATIQNKNVIRIFLDGIKYIVEQPAIYVIIIIGFFANAVMSPIDSLQPAFVVEVFYEDSSYLSLLNVLLSIGMLLGSALFPTLRIRIKESILYCISFAYFSFLYFYVTVCGYEYILLLYGKNIFYPIYFMYGFFAAIVATGLGIQILELTENNHIARVTTVYNSLCSMATPLAAALAGFMNRYIHISLLFMILGVVAIFITGIIFLIIPRLELHKFKHKCFEKTGVNK